MARAGKGEGVFGDLAAPARRALVGAGITSLEQLSRLTEAQVASLHGMGPNAMARLREMLAAEGRKFAPPNS